MSSTISNSPKVLKTKFVGSHGISCFSSICKFGSLKNLFATIPGLYFRPRKPILLVQTKKMTSMNYGSSASCWRPWRWVRLDLILTMRNIYINSNPKPLTKFSSSGRSTEPKDILPWNISQMITKMIPISTRISISYAMKRDIPFWVYWKVYGHWKNNWIRIYQWREVIVEQILASEERKKSRRAGL